MVFTFMQYPPEADLSRQLLTHVYDELHHLDDDFNYSIDRTNLVLASHGARLSKDIGRVKYVGECDLDRQQGVHMVLQGAHGPVTVMMMPQRKVEQHVQISDQRFHGSIEPMARGSVAIIAEKGEPIDDLRHALADSIEWNF